MRSLLFIEDQEGMREEGELIAKAKGYNVSTASNLKEAFKIIRTRPSLSVLLTDIHLDSSRDADDQNKDGRTIATATRRENRGVTIVGTSSRFEEPQICEEDDSPFDLFSKKRWIEDPDEANNLFNTINELVEKNTIKKQSEKDRLANVVSSIELEGFTASKLFRHSEVKDVELVVLDNDDAVIIVGNSELIAVPIPVWIKECNHEGKTFYYAEVYKFSTISTLAETREQAISLLIKLFEKIRRFRTDHSEFPNSDDFGLDPKICEEFVKYLTK